MDGARQAERRPRSVPGHADCIPGNGVRGEPVAPVPFIQECGVSRWHGHHSWKINSIDCHLVILTWPGEARDAALSGAKITLGFKEIHVSVEHGYDLLK